MSIDRDLVGTIKRTFSDYSSVTLQEIAQSQDQSRWSLEAVQAARELLNDRLAHRVSEPALAKKPECAPPPSPDPYNLGLIIGAIALGAASGVGFFRIPDRGEEDTVRTDQPIPFGSKMAWLAIDTTETREIAKALGLIDVRSARWEEGLEAAYQSSIFTTPPVADWTLAAGTPLFPRNRAEVFIKPLLERLSRQFGEAQYFATQRDLEMHIWARAKKGRLIRGYGWLGEKHLTLWDEGQLTGEEKDLGFQFKEGLSPDGAAPDENCVMQIASFWSIDPTALDAEYKEAVLGCLGKATFWQRP